MGGHHHVKIPKVPDYTIYKVEDSKYLTKIQERLAEKGLKDPWLRNHVWRRHLHRGIKNPNWQMLAIVTWGWKIWVPLVALTIGVETFLGIDYHAHGSHDHDHKEGGDGNGHH